MAMAKSERRRTTVLCGDSNRVQEHQGVKLRGKIEQGSSLPRERALRLAQFVEETAGRRFPGWRLQRTPAVNLRCVFCVRVRENNKGSGGGYGFGLKEAKEQGRVLPTMRSGRGGGGCLRARATREVG
jgi:hypothetical protein